MKSSQESQLSFQHKKRKIADLDPASFNLFQAYSHKYNLEALERVHFRRHRSNQDQHLDAGSGPANFLVEHLIPRLHPFRRVVGADISSEMLEYARSHYDFSDVSFELLDIEHGDPQTIVDKYGTFNRVYSFLTFHYVCNLEKAYRNIHRLLKDAGECLVVYFTRTGFSDVWHKLYQDEEWRRYMPDLGAMVADRFCMNKPVPEQELIALESSSVKAAGLDLVTCRTFSNTWTFPNKNECLDAYMRFFKLDAKVPLERRSAFRDAWMSALLEESANRAPGGGIALVYEFILAHAQKPERPA